MATKKAKKKVVKKVKAKVVVLGRLSLYGPVQYGMGHVLSADEMILGSRLSYRASIYGGIPDIHGALEDLYAKAGGESLGRKVKITFELA